MVELKFPYFSFAAFLLSSMISSLEAGNLRNFYEDYTRIRVSGPSMLQTLQSREQTLAYKHYPFKKLRQQDIAIIEWKRFNTIHRIVSRYRGGRWITRGDNNKHDDRELLGRDNFRGLVLVDPSSVERYLKYMDKERIEPPQDVLTYVETNQRSKR